MLYGGIEWDGMGWNILGCAGGIYLAIMGLELG